MQKLRRILSVFIVASLALTLKANTASFTFTTVCDGDTTSFASTSTASVGTIILEEWDFDGDSIFDVSGNTAKYFWATPGTYDVLLRVTTDSGFVGYTTNSVSVDPNPVVNFVSAGNCLGEVTKFTSNVTISSGSISSYNWEFNGNGDFADGTNADETFTFIGAGYYNIGLQGTSDRGCVTELYNTISIAPKPKANFSTSNVCDGKSVEFQNTSVSPGPSVAYSWDFGNGTNSNLVEPSLVYGNPGTFTIKLVAENPSGCKDSLSRSVEVYPNPVAGLVTNDVCIGRETTLENTSNNYGADVENNFWDFGDGTSRFDLNTVVTKTYNISDVFDVMLTVKTTDGCTDTTSETITINPLPVYPIETSGGTEFCEGGSVTLEVNTDSTTSALWSTGVLAKSIEVSESGLYEVVLFTPEGCEYKTQEEVIVNTGSSLETSNDTTIENGSTISLTVDGSQFYEWSGFADGSTSSNKTVEVSPQVNTTYSILATNEFGCESSAEITVFVDNSYNLIPSNLMTPDANGQNDFFYVENIDRYPDCEVQIYNSFGKMVYSQKGYMNDFDGTINAGEKLPEGTYYYIISCDGIDNNFSGAVNILRINE